MLKNAVFSADFNTGETRNLRLPDGTLHEDTCIANIGKISGTARAIKTIMCDGVQADDKWSIYNITNAQGHFIDHVAVVGAVSAEQSERLVQRYLLPLYDGAIQSHQTLTDNGIKHFLDSATTASNIGFLMVDDVNDFESRITKTEAIWDNATLKTHSGSLSSLLFDIQQHDPNGEIIERVTARDIASSLIDSTCEVQLHDAIVVKYRELDKTIDKIAKQLGELSDMTLKIVQVHKLEPFKKNGVVNGGAIFEMSDNQTITVLFNNPDTTPAKITPDDTMTSWKWLLNRRDVSAALQPRSVEAKKYNLIAQRMFKLVAANHDRFVRSQVKKLKEQQEFEQAQTNLTAAEARLSELDQLIIDEQTKIDKALADKQAAFEAALASQKVNENGLTNEAATELMNHYDDLLTAFTNIKTIEDVNELVALSESLNDISPKLSELIEKGIQGITVEDWAQNDFWKEATQANASKDDQLASIQARISELSTDPNVSNEPDTGSVKKVTQKEIQKFYDSFAWLINYYKGHIGKEFTNADVGERLNKKIAEAQALLERPFRKFDQADWYRNSLQSRIDEGLNMIADWNTKRDQQNNYDNVIVYLNQIIDGDIDPLEEGLVPKVREMISPYLEDQDIAVLALIAAKTIGDAKQTKALEQRSKMKVVD